jgi:hypothetical protein
MSKETVGLVIPDSSVANANRTSAGAVLRALDKITSKKDAARIDRLERQAIAMQREIDRLIVFAKTASKAIESFGAATSNLEKRHG